MRVTIASGVLDRVRAHAAADAEREVCGLLLGSGAAVVGLVEADNVAKSPSDSFVVDPTVLFAAQRAARAGGPGIVGHYHSHPRGSCVPSTRDESAAVPGQLWLIVARGETALYRAASGGFVRCAMINGPSPPCGSPTQSPEGRRRDGARGQGPA